MVFFSVALGPEQEPEQGPVQEQEQAQVQEPVQVQEHHSLLLQNEHRMQQQEERQQNEVSMQRAFLITQLLAPPLPMLCTGSNGEERISSSHDLLWVLFGRLFSLKARQEKITDDEHAGGGGASTMLVPWHEYILSGTHTETLLRALVSANTSKYEAFCAYTRSVISITVAADRMSAYSGCSIVKTKSEWDCSGGTTSIGTTTTTRTEDVRFMQDISRVSKHNSGTLVQSTFDFYRSLIIFRLEEEESGEADSVALRKQPMQYDVLCIKCMNAIASIAPDLLKSLSMTG